MKRIFLFLITNLAVMLVLGTVAQLLGLDRYDVQHTTWPWAQPPPVPAAPKEPKRRRWRRRLGLRDGAHGAGAST